MRPSPASEESIPFVPESEAPYLYQLCSQFYTTAARPAAKSYEGNLPFLLEKDLAVLKARDGGDFVEPTKKAFLVLQRLGIPLRLTLAEPDPVSSYLGLRIEQAIAAAMRNLLPDYQVRHGRVIEFRDPTSGDSRTQLDLIFIPNAWNHVTVLEVKYRNGTQQSEAQTLWAPAQATNALWVNRKRAETRYAEQVLKQGRIIHACANASLGKLNFHLKHKFTAAPTVTSLLYWYGPVKIQDQDTMAPIKVQDNWYVIPARPSPDITPDAAEMERLAGIIRQTAPNG